MTDLIEELARAMLAAIENGQNIDDFADDLCGFPERALSMLATAILPIIAREKATPVELAGLVEELKARSNLPSAFDFVGNKVEDLFDQGLRHQSGKKPVDYLRVWLSMLRPFAYASHDDSWGELEKLLCIVMRNYVEMKRECGQAATAIEALSRQFEAGARAGIEALEGWRGIESAPLTGAHIWLSNGFSMRIGFWAKGSEHENFGTIGGGWIDFASAEGTGPRGLRFEAKCWQPLPSPPKGDQ